MMRTLGLLDVDALATTATASAPCTFLSSLIVVCRSTLSQNLERPSGPCPSMRCKVNQRKPFGLNSCLCTIRHCCCCWDGFDDAARIFLFFFLRRSLRFVRFYRYTSLAGPASERTRYHDGMQAESSAGTPDPRPGGGQFQISFADCSSSTGDGASRVGIVTNAGAPALHHTSTEQRGHHRPIGTHSARGHDEEHTFRTQRKASKAADPHGTAPGVPDTAPRRPAHSR